MTEQDRRNEQLEGKPLYLFVTGRVEVVKVTSVSAADKYEQ